MVVSEKDNYDEFVKDEVAVDYVDGYLSGHESFVLVYRSHLTKGADERENEMSLMYWMVGLRCLV